MNVTWSELDKDRLFTPKLWKGLALPISGPFPTTLSGNPAVGMFDDFIGFGGALSTNTGSYNSGPNRWRSYQTASTLLTTVALTPTPASVAPTSIGAIVLQPTSGVADNDEVYLHWGGHELTPFGTFPFSAIPGMSGDLIFEARFKVSSITADIGNWFVGLMGAAGVNTVANVVPFADADTLATTQSVLGFGKLAADDADINFWYERASGTAAEVDTEEVHVADTYKKLGFRYHGHSKRCSIWVDGVELTSKALASSVTGATPWPNDYMAPVIATKQKDGTTALNLTVDWIACAQYL